MTKLQKISIVIPFRGGDSFRISNMVAVLKHLSNCLPHADIVIVEQDLVSKIDTLISDFTTKHLLVEDESAFNKSRLVNIGVGNTGTNCVMVSDADVLVPSESLAKSISAVATELEFVRPYHDLIDLDKQQTQEYLSHGELPDAHEPGQTLNRMHLGENLCIAGGSFIIRKNLFDELGGFDERFLGWGGEDDAFSLRVNSASNKVALLKQSFAWHLWHPRDAAQNNPHYQHNRKLLRQTQIEIAQQHHRKVLETPEH